MAFAFGDTLICTDADTTKLVAFSAQVGGVRSVMFDGDVYDPSGTLLVRVQALRAAEGRVAQMEAALRKVEREFGVLREGGGPRNRWGS
jgi:structural maintenance of chromosome 2